MLDNLIPTLLTAASDFSNNQQSGAIGYDKIEHAIMGAAITCVGALTARCINKKERAPPIPPYIAGALLTLALEWVWETCIDPHTLGYVRDVADITGDYIATMAGALIYVVGDALVAKRRRQKN